MADSKDEGGYLLSKRDRNTIADLVRWWRREGKTKGTVGSRPQPNEEDDVGKYIARTVTPITALSSHTTGTGTGTVVNDDVPGYGTCEIYKLFQLSDVPGDIVIYPAGFSRTVYSLSLDQVGKDKWVHVAQDNFGIWWIIEFHSLSDLIDWNIDYVSNVCIDFVAKTATIEHSVRKALSGKFVNQYCENNPVDCCPIQVICCDGTVYLLPRKVCALVTAATGIYAPYLGRHIQFTYFEPTNSLYASGYTSDVSDIPGLVNHSFCMQFFCNNLSVGVSWEISRCQGVGLNPLFGFDDSDSGRAILGCPDPADILPAITDPPYGNGSDKITFYLTEGICPDTTGTGTGTSGSTSTFCCVAGLPPTLHITLNEDCLAGSYPIVFNPSSTQWNYFGAANAVCAGGQLSASMQCFGGNWVVSVSCVRGTAIQTWQWTIAPTCTLPLTLNGITGVTSGGGSPCMGVLASLSGSVHT